MSIEGTPMTDINALNLRTLCTPKDDVFSNQVDEEVWDISQLHDKSFDAKKFFDNNYRTEGMKVLYTKAFQRLLGNSQGESGIIELSQAMGGGKTHNMFALGLLAQHLDMRPGQLDDIFPNHTALGKVETLVFTGRDSNDIFWAELAKQLGKPAFGINPPVAPSRQEWINLLQGSPKIIFLDELPPYLNNAKTIQIGAGTLLDVCKTAIANLFAALQAPELSNILVVFASLDATAYEEGGSAISDALKEVTMESKRLSTSITPVDNTKDELIDILRKRQFVSLPSDEEIEKVARAYKEAHEDAKKAGLTISSSEELYTAIKRTYPFHPSFLETFKKFNENLNWQKTRGTIRLVKKSVAYVYSTDIAEQEMLLEVHHFDYNDTNTRNQIVGIKNSIQPALDHDVSANGKAEAEIIAKTDKDNEIVSLIAKTIYMNSLSNVPGGITGLKQHELVDVLITPNRNVSNVKQLLAKLQNTAWYLHMKDDKSYVFHEEQNIVAKTESYMSAYNEEQAAAEIKNSLIKYTAPINKKCYSIVKVFPSLDEIELQRDEVTLIIARPTGEETPNRPEVARWFEQQTFKNRVLFLTGTSESAYGSLVQLAKKIKALTTIIGELKRDGLSAADQQMKEANKMLEDAIFQFHSNIQNTFISLSYPTNPSGNKIMRTVDFKMTFSNNKYDIEEQIEKTLDEKMKYYSLVDTNKDDTNRKLIQGKMFFPDPNNAGANRPTPFSEIKRNAAINPGLPIFNATELEVFKIRMCSADHWREENGVLSTGPFLNPPTLSVAEMSHENGYTLKFSVGNSSSYSIHYELGKDNVSLSSPTLTPEEIKNGFDTEEFSGSFVAVDNNDPTLCSQILTWVGNIELDIDAKCQDDSFVLSASSTPNVEIYYSHDGTNIINSDNVLSGPVKFDSAVKEVVLQARGKNASSEIRIVKNPCVGTPVPLNNPVTYTRQIKINSNHELNSLVGALKEYEGRCEIKQFDLFVTSGEMITTEYKDIFITGEKLGLLRDFMVDHYFNGSAPSIEINIAKTYFRQGAQFKAFMEKLGLEYSPNDWKETGE